MPARLIDGKAIAAKVFSALRTEAAALPVKPTLAVVLVGDDPASSIYVNMKEKRCLENGFGSRVYRLPAATTREELLELVRTLNADAGVHGILVQSPLPAHIEEQAVVETIAPDKDVDCFHPYNMGRLAAGDPVFLPCTPAGVLELLDASGIEIAGKRAVVVGRSNIAGKPLALLLLARHATVTLCHSRTAALAEETRRADILLVAIGKPGFVSGDMIREGCVVVDVGINRVADPAAPGGYRIVGDVDQAQALEKASWFTPVPGGVGAMTIAMLLRNTLHACRLQAGRS